jgi:hypothetical protein
MENVQQHGNRLLATLDRTDFELLAPHLCNVPLVQGFALQEQEAPVEKVYFPVSGVISLISVMEGGEVIETAMVGREGAFRRVRRTRALERIHACGRAVAGPCDGHPSGELSSRGRSK